MAKALRLRHTQFSIDHVPLVTVTRMVTNRTVVTHRHDFLEIAIVLSGQALHVTGNERHPIQMGDVLIIHSRRSHSYEKLKELSLVNILIREGLLREIDNELGMLPGYHALFTLESARWRQSPYRSHLRLSAGDLKKISTWVNALEYETKLAREGGRLLARAWLYLIVGMLSRCYGKEMTRSSQREFPMANVLSWIEEHFAEPMTLKSLAHRSAMSERTFLRRFQEAMGASPIDYLIRVRIRRAQEWLAESHRQLSITEIAFQCGFQDGNYFSRQFRRLIGVSPQQYRKQARTRELPASTNSQSS